SPITLLLCFFLTAPAPSAIYTLSLHDALPIFRLQESLGRLLPGPSRSRGQPADSAIRRFESLKRRQPLEDELYFLGSALMKKDRSEEHTSELQSRSDLVCRLLLEKKKKI